MSVDYVNIADLDGAHVSRSRNGTTWELEVRGNKVIFRVVNNDRLRSSHSPKEFFKSFAETRDVLQQDGIVLVKAPLRRERRRLLLCVSCESEQEFDEDDYLCVVCRAAGVF